MARALQADPEISIGEGDPVTEMTQYARRLQAELVVVGPTGATGLARLLLGSVAEGVVRAAPCSVLVAR